MNSMPLAVRRGVGIADGEASACTSTSTGRLPSTVGTITEPIAPCSRSARKTSEGFSTQARPLPSISKTPTSETAPKRFFTPRSSR